MRRWLIALLAALIEPAPAESAPLVKAQRGSWSVLDGVDYRMPVPVLARLRDMGDGVVAAFLREASKVYHAQFATPYLTDQPVQQLSIADPLTEWDWSTRRDVLEQCHLAWERNPNAAALVRYTRLFSVQNGASITYRNDQVQEVCEAFLEHDENDWKQLEKQLCDSLFVDGELFVRFHRGTGAEGRAGEVIITTVPPWGVRAIRHTPGFMRRVEAYRLTYTQDNGDGMPETVHEDVPASEMLHVTINRMPYEQRGRSELFRFLPWLRAHKELLENMARNIYYTNILYDVSLEGANASQVAAKRAQYREVPAGGALAIHNDKETWQVMSTSRVQGDDVEVARQLKIMTLAGVIPEYMVGDGANANLASATAQQLPALRSFGEWQDIMGEQVVGAILRKVIQINVEAGILPEEVAEQDTEGEATEQTIKATEAFDVRYPELESDDPKALVEALQIATANEWVSDETAQSLLPWDIDPVVEQRKIEAQLEKRRDEIAVGLRQMPLPFGQFGPGGAGGPGENQNNNEEEPKQKGVSNGKAA